MCKGDTLSVLLAELAGGTDVLFVKLPGDVTHDTGALQGARSA